MATIRQSKGFANNTAYASAPYAAGVGSDGGEVFAWAETSAAATGASLSTVWEDFKARCLDGAWGAGFPYDGDAFPDAVVLASGVIINSAGLYILWVIFASTPAGAFTPPA